MMVMGWDHISKSDSKIHVCVLNSKIQDIVAVRSFIAMQDNPDHELLTILYGQSIGSVDQVVCNPSIKPFDEIGFLAPDLTVQQLFSGEIRRALRPISRVHELVVFTPSELKLRAEALGMDSQNTLDNILEFVNELQLDLCLKFNDYEYRRISKADPITSEAHIRQEWPTGCISSHDEELIQVNDRQVSVKLLATKLTTLDRAYMDARDYRGQLAGRRFIRRLASDWEGNIITLIYHFDCLDSITIAAQSLIGRINRIERVYQLVASSREELQQRCLKLSATDYEGASRVNHAGTFVDACEKFLKQFALPIGHNFSLADLGKVRNSRGFTQKDFVRARKESRLVAYKSYNKVASRY